MSYSFLSEVFKVQIIFDDDLDKANDIISLCAILVYQ